MAIDWENAFRDWAKAPGSTEQTKCNNALGMVQSAVSRSPNLAGRNIEVFAQGSFRNRTNVPGDSDVDICVVCHDTFFYDLPNGGRADDFFQVIEPSYKYADHKNNVESALISHLGRGAVAHGNKALSVRETTYHVDADVVACFEYRYYQPNRSYYEGTAFLTDKGVRINNWPEQNYENGVKKNEATHERFKAIVRVLKNLRNAMELNGDRTVKAIPSYLIECLVWSVPNNSLGNGYYYDDVRNSLIHLFNKTKTSEESSDLFEVNGIKYLFHTSQAWQFQQANQFIASAWSYVGFR